MFVRSGCNRVPGAVRQHNTYTPCFTSRSVVVYLNRIHAENHVARCLLRRCGVLQQLLGDLQQPGVEHRRIRSGIALQKNLPRTFDPALLLFQLLDRFLTLAQLRQLRAVLVVEAYSLSSIFILLSIVTVFDEYSAVHSFPVYIAATFRYF